MLQFFFSFKHLPVRKIAAEPPAPVEAAALWCKDMGAIWLAEVKENSEELADHLGLRPLERRRLLRSLG